MSIPHFVTWNKVEEGYYTKTKLRNDFGLKPRDEKDYDATLRAYMSGSWRDYVLYHIDDTVEIKRRKIADIEPTDQNLAEALYIINKSAKVSRDTKTENYTWGRHKIVATSKTRQNQLYEIKDAVIKKLLREEKMHIIGYHQQKSKWNGDNLYFLLGEIKGYQFHIPTGQHIVTSYNYLGEIERISAERTRQVSLKFFESKKMLEKYIAVEEVLSVS